MMDNGPERQAILAGECPDCRCRRFFFGPRGNTCRNVECADCGSRFIVTVVNRKVVLAERIENNVDWAACGYSRFGELGEAVDIWPANLI